LDFVSSHKSKGKQRWQRRKQWYRQLGRQRKTPSSKTTTGKARWVLGGGSAPPVASAPRVRENQVCLNPACGQPFPEGKAKPQIQTVEGQVANALYLGDQLIAAKRLADDLGGVDILAKVLKVMR
jgi:hypothetical protein